MPTAAKEKTIGKVVHYYDKLGVAIIELTSKLSTGDTITFKRGDSELTETVESLQIEHESVEKAKKGDSVGMKVSEKVKTGSKVVLA